MKKDIAFPKVEGLAMAIVPDKLDAAHATGWSVYLINLEERILDTVLVTSRGYGEIDGRKKDTSVMRHQIGTIAGPRGVKVESMIEEVFQLTNEFWVSFWLDGQLYDKKYLFVPGSIHPNNFTDIPVLKDRGVMIK